MGFELPMISLLKIDSYYYSITSLFSDCLKIPFFDSNLSLLEKPAIAGLLRQFQTTKILHFFSILAL
jgi:hypothetical protein